MPDMKELVDTYGSELYEKLQNAAFFIENVIGLKMTSYQKEWLELAEKNKRLNLSAFRSSGKTEVLLVLYPIFKAFQTKNYQIMIVSSSLPQSTEVLKRIKDRLMDNELLRTAIPSGREATWSKTEIELKNGSRIFSKTCTDSIRGYHVDKTVCDEIGEYRDHDIFFNGITPIVTAKDGSIICVGTPKSQIDLIHKLQEEPYSNLYISKVYAANGKDTNGKTYWENRYPKIPMRVKKAEYSSITWSQEYLCKPLGKGDQLFPYTLIESAYDYAGRFYLRPKQHAIYYMGVDFALSGRSGADYTVITVVEKMDNVVRVVFIDRFKGLSYPAQKDRIQQIYHAFKATKALIDERSFGKTFLQDLRAMNLAVEGFIATNVSKTEMLELLRNTFERNLSEEGRPLPEKEKTFLIHRDKSCLKTYNTTTALTKELLSYGAVYDEDKHSVSFKGVGSHDDMVTSLMLAVKCAKGSESGSMKFYHSFGRSSSDKSNIFVVTK